MIENGLFFFLSYLRFEEKAIKIWIIASDIMLLSQAMLNVLWNITKRKEEWKTSTICIFVNKSPYFLCERGIHPSAVTNDPINTNIVFKIWREGEPEKPLREAPWKYLFVE